MLVLGCKVKGDLENDLQLPKEPLDMPAWKLTISASLFAMPSPYHPQIQGLTQNLVC